jgi:hypothetical protein
MNLIKSNGEMMTREEYVSSCINDAEKKNIPYNVGDFYEKWDEIIS